MNDIQYLDNKVAIECEEVSTTPTYRLTMTNSASETIIATVSTIGLQGSTTHVIENTLGDSPVGGDSTTSDVWDIRVFDYNSPFDALTSHYIIRVLFTPALCQVRVWKNG
jgi:hypothetical protein